MNVGFVVRTGGLFGAFLKTPWRSFSARWANTGHSNFKDSPSVKESELKKFENFNWWNEGDQIGSLQHLNPVRCRFINTVSRSWFGAVHQGSPLQGRSVLDVGCGMGIFAESLGRLGGDVLGIDVINSNIEGAQRHLELDPRLKEQIQYKCVSAEELLMTQERRFDLVIASEVIEHVEDPMEFLKTLSKLMDPGGLLCITTINRTLRSWAGAIVAAERLLGLLPRGTHDWESFITPDELSMAGTQIGLSMEHLVGFELNLLTKKWRLGSDVSINYGATFSKQPQNKQQNNNDTESDDDSGS